MKSSKLAVFIWDFGGSGSLSCEEAIDRLLDCSDGKTEVERLVIGRAPQPLLPEMIIVPSEVSIESFLISLVYRAAIQFITSGRGQWEDLHFYLLAEFHSSYIPMFEHLTDTLHCQVTMVCSKPVRSRHAVLSKIKCLKYPEFEPASSLTGRGSIKETEATEQNGKQDEATTTKTSRRSKPQVSDLGIFVGLLQTLYDNTVRKHQAYHPASTICTDLSSKMDFKQLGFRKFKFMLEEAHSHGLCLYENQDITVGAEIVSLTHTGYCFLLSRSGGRMFPESPQETSERLLARTAMLERSEEHFHPLIYAMFDQPVKLWTENSLGLHINELKKTLYPFMGEFYYRYIQRAEASGLITLNKEEKGAFIRLQL